MDWLGLLTIVFPAICFAIGYCFGYRDRDLRRLVRSAPPNPIHEPTGKPKRPRSGSCPGCGVTQDEWCKPGCSHIDMMDYR